MTGPRNERTGVEDDVVEPRRKLSLLVGPLRKDFGQVEKVLRQKQEEQQPPNDACGHRETLKSRFSPKPNGNENQQEHGV